MSTDPRTAREQLEQAIAVCRQAVLTCDGYRIPETKQAEADAKDALIDACLAHQRPPEWQPIETAPKGFQSVIGCADDNEMRTTHWDDIEGAWMKDRAYGDLPTTWKPTHWMPLPDPPAGRPPEPTDQETP